MPNGDDRNLIRLCAALDGFHARYRRWPSQVRLQQAYIDDLRHLLSSDDFARLRAKIELVVDDAHIVAEDGAGGQYNYAEEGFPDSVEPPSAIDWIGLRMR